MKKIELKKNWLYKLDRYFYDDFELPASNTCTFKARLIMIFLIIITLFGTWGILSLLGEKIKPYQTMIVKFITMALSLVIVSGMIEEILLHISFLHLSIVAFLFSTTFITIIINTFAGIIMSIIKVMEFVIWIFRRVFIRRNKKFVGYDIEKTSSMFSVMYDSIKDKTCSKITWK